MNIKKLQKEAKKFKTVESFINSVIKETVNFDFKLKKRIENINSKVPYFNFVKSHFVAPQLVEKNWDKNISKKRIENNSLLEIGKNYPDGFSGIKIKKAPYRDRWLLELVDGERGQQLIKTYNKFPNKEQVLMDSIVSVLIPQDVSIVDIFNNGGNK